MGSYTDPPLLADQKEEGKVNTSSRRRWNRFSEFTEVLRDYSYNTPLETKINEKFIYLRCQTRVRYGYSTGT